MKILLVQVSFLGDVVLSTPVIQALRERYPQAELWMMTTPLASDLVKRDPNITGVLSFDKRKKHSGLRGTIEFIKELRAHKFDKVFSLHRSFRTALVLYLSGIKERIGYRQARGAFLYTTRVERRSDSHDVLRNLSLLDSGYSEQDSPQLALYPPSENEVSIHIRKLFEDPLYSPVVLVPGSVWATKRWHWQRYHEFARALTEEHGESVCISGAPAEQEVCSLVADGLNVVNLAGKTSLADLLYLFQRAKAVICNDSMALHIASAFKVPTVSIFCATSPSFGFGPWRNRAEVVEKEDLPCKPCRRHGSNICPTGTESCMRDVSAGQVESAYLRVVGQ